MKVVLDTHIWVWWLLPDSPLPDRERMALDRIAADNGVLLPAICLWEAQMLHRRKRIELPVPFPTWLRRATSADMLSVLPLNTDTDTDTVIAVDDWPASIKTSAGKSNCRRSDDLPAAFHGDPADRMIVATARVYELSLATHDEAIRKSRLVRIWKP